MLESNEELIFDNTTETAGNEKSENKFNNLNEVFGDKFH